MSLTPRDSTRKPSDQFEGYRTTEVGLPALRLPQGWSRTLSRSDAAWVATYIHRSPEARHLMAAVVLADAAVMPDEALEPFARKLRPILLRLAGKGVNRG